MFVRLSFLAVCFLALGFAAHAQQSGLAPPVAPDAPAFPLRKDNISIGWATQREPDPSREIRKKVAEATAMLKKAEDTDAKATAKERLESVLVQEYDAHMDIYEAQIDKMEQQIIEMRKKLSRRREAKLDMVKLRMKMLEAEADDLGWPSASGGRYGRVPGLRSDFFSFEEYHDHAVPAVVQGVAEIPQFRQ